MSNFAFLQLVAVPISSADSANATPKPPGVPAVMNLRSNKVHRYENLLADLQHHPTTRMNAALGQ